jgi:hypothetical protein
MNAAFRAGLMQPCPGTAIGEERLTFGRSARKTLLKQRNDEHEHEQHLF